MAAEKLKDGDVADAKLRQLIVKDMDEHQIEVGRDISERSRSQYKLL